MGDSTKYIFSFSRYSIYFWPVTVQGEKKFDAFDIQIERMAAVILTEVAQISHDMNIRSIPIQSALRVKMHCNHAEINKTVVI